MALTRCLECGRLVSERAEACPKCGNPSRFFTANSLPEPLVAMNGDPVGASNTRELAGPCPSCRATATFVTPSLTEQARVVASEIDGDTRDNIIKRAIISSVRDLANTFRGGKVAPLYKCGHCNLCWYICGHCARPNHPRVNQQGRCDYCQKPMIT